MLDTGLDTDTFQTFITQLRRFVRERLVAAEDATIEDNRIPDAVIDEMRAMGLMGLTVPEEFGGAGLSVSQYIDVIVEIGWVTPAFRAVMAIGTGIVATAIKVQGTDEQKQAYLTRLAEGAIAGFCLTEPDSGSDSAAMKTRAVRDGDDYVITGTKRYITNAPLADFFLVMARTSAEALPSHAHVSAFLVPADTPGITIGKPDKKMGQRGALTADVTFDEVRVPAAALLGGVEGKGFRAAMLGIDGGRLSVGANAIGYARRILKSAMTYAMERKAFNQPIAQFQLVQAMLADSKAELYAAECMLRDACQRADRGEKILEQASCVKMYATEMVGRVADRAVQIYGGAGYMAEYEVERFFRDARVFRIYEGTTQIMQTVIAKAMIKDFANGDFG